MRILVFSSTPWNIDNSFGNTYSNLFEGIDDFEFANIYTSYGVPKNNITSSYFQINEKSLYKNLFNRNIKTGKVIGSDNDAIVLTNRETNTINAAKKRRWRILFWLRRALWYISRWKSIELIEFVRNFKPDIIFVPLYHSTYLNRIILYIKELTGVQMVCYVSDDVYTLKRISANPLFWVDRLTTRRMVKKVVDQCEYMYVISDIQKLEYEKIFKKNCKILIKGADFKDENQDVKTELNKPIRMVFTGNVSAGRWKSLELIVNALEKINSKEILAQIYIYTMTPMTETMKKSLYSEGNSFLMGGVPAENIPQIQKDSDILIHVESTKLKERLEVRHSFSTKIVDYFKANRCIFAVGKDDVASIDYLINEDAAIVAQSEEDVFIKLSELVNDSKLMFEYSNKAWECGKRNHQKNVIQDSLYQELKLLAEED
ncbi:hypothetical protein SAMN04488048_11556 [Trichococcus flocculiformis]|uniref:hypothetical protein n=1 Tax=Trichococcus TaxID=82802 RepID=UPI0007A90895|nr:MULTISPECIES: hypothetical protein [Trichococcus]CZR05631.1 glycosyl transferases group 1 [Trichococcus sp. ES5]SHF88909.1 hypothetical protein SAMN04488048_11556 [Trichococcus flocculiformis]